MLKLAGCLAGVSLGVTQGLGASFSNVTAYDYAGPNSLPAWNPYSWGPGPTAGVDPVANYEYGAGGEDNETENTTIATRQGQLWDLEAFVVGESAGSSRPLYLVGGFNFESGQGAVNPGDLFITVGNPQPSSTPSLSSFSYVVRLNNPGNDLAGGSASVYKLDKFGVGTAANASGLIAVQNPQLNTNPWKYTPGVNEAADYTTTIAYTSGLASTDAALTGMGLALLDDADETSENPRNYPEGNQTTHNILEIDLGFLYNDFTAAYLNNPANPIYLTYTMQCGNDGIKGELTGGFRDVPDGGLTVMLLGFGLACIPVARRRFERV